MGKGTTLVPIRGITNDQMPMVNIANRQFQMAISTVPGDFSPVNKACSGNFLFNKQQLQLGRQPSVSSADLFIQTMSAPLDRDIILNLKSEVDSAYVTAAQTPSIDNIKLLDDLKRVYKDTEIAVENAEQGNVCLLENGVQYYVNVRPLNPGCSAIQNGEITRPDMQVGQYLQSQFNQSPNESKGICSIEVSW